MAKAVKEREITTVSQKGGLISNICRERADYTEVSFEWPQKNNTDIVKDREAWQAAVHSVSKSQTQPRD